MKTLLASAAALLFAMAGPVRAEPINPVPGPSPVIGPLHKLPASMKVDGPALRAVPELPALVPYGATDKALEEVGKRLADLKSARAAAVDVYNTCKAKSYSQQEMVEAGCQASDTVEACGAKLFKRCTRGPYSAFAKAEDAFSAAVDRLVSESRKAVQQGLPR